MRINDKNGATILREKISLHDDTFSNLTFDQKTRELCLLAIDNERSHTPYLLRFQNVVGFEMTACAFWMTSPYIFSFEYVYADKRTLLPKLYQKLDQIGDEFPCYLSRDKSYIETSLFLSSGDVLIVVCEEILLEGNHEITW